MKSVRISDNINPDTYGPAGNNLKLAFLFFSFYFWSVLRAKVPSLFLLYLLLLFFVQSKVFLFMHRFLSVSELSRAVLNHVKQVQLTATLCPSRKLGRTHCNTLATLAPSQRRLLHCIDNTASKPFHCSNTSPPHKCSHPSQNFTHLPTTPDPLSLRPSPAHPPHPLADALLGSSEGPAFGLHHTYISEGVNGCRDVNSPK